MGTSIVDARWQPAYALTAQHSASAIVVLPGIQTVNTIANIPTKTGKACALLNQVVNAAGSTICEQGIAVTISPIDGRVRKRIFRMLMSACNLGEYVPTMRPIDVFGLIKPCNDTIEYFG